MDLIVLTGSDRDVLGTRRAELVELHGPVTASFDAREDSGAGFVAALRNPGLFGRSFLLVDSFETLSKESQNELSARAGASTAVVVGRCEKAPAPGLRSLIQRLGTLECRDLPRGGGAVRSCSLEYGVRLDQAQQAFAGTVPLARLRQGLAQLSSAGITNPTHEELVAAVGHEQRAAAPWELTDAISAQDRAAALAVAGRLVPAVGAGAVTRWLGQVARVAESGDTSPQHASKLLGLRHPFQAERIAQLAAHVPPARLLEGLAFCGRLAVEVRSANGREALELGSLHLIDVLHGPGPSPRQGVPAQR